MSQNLIFEDYFNIYIQYIQSAFLLYIFIDVKFSIYIPTKLSSLAAVWSIVTAIFETSKLVSLRRIIYFNDVFHRNDNSLTFINVKSFLLKRGMKNQYFFPKVFHGNVILPLFFLFVERKKEIQGSLRARLQYFMEPHLAYPTDPIKRISLRIYATPPPSSLLHLIMKWPV